MAITDVLKPGQAGGEQRDFTCPHYDPVPGGKRCKSYVENGACSRPDEFMCVEWLKANGNAVQREEKKPSSTVPTDLFGKPIPQTPAREQKASDPLPSLRSHKPLDLASPEFDEENTPTPRGLTTEDIESFKALGVEVRIKSEAIGEIWLVPVFTGKDRLEILPEHVATLAHVLIAFPGSQIVSFTKQPPRDESSQEGKPS